MTPDAYLGRMVATMRFLTVASAPLGALSAGFALGALALTAWTMLFTSLRSVRD